MFNEGDLIVYGASGVCRVGETIQMEGKDYLKLCPVFQRETIFMPLFSDKVRVRSVITREEAEQLRDKLVSIEIDQELIQGATMDLLDSITVTNNNEYGFYDSWMY